MKDSSDRYGYVPIFCDLRGRSVVVIGGGNVAERKIKGLVEAGAAVTVISPEVTPLLSGMVEQGLVQLVPRQFQNGDLHGAWLVVAATDDEAVQKSVYNEAQERRIFCNVVDKPEVCSFIVPSTVRRGDLCLAISTGGRSPALAKALRKDLEKKFGPEWSVMISLIGKLRALILEDCQGKEAGERCSGIADPAILKWIEKGDWKRLEDWAAAICGDRARTIVKELQQ